MLVIMVLFDFTKELICNRVKCCLSVCVSVLIEDFTLAIFEADFLILLSVYIVGNVHHEDIV